VSSSSKTQAINGPTMADKKVSVKDTISSRMNVTKVTNKRYLPLESPEFNLKITTQQL